MIFMVYVDDGISLLLLAIRSTPFAIRLMHVRDRRFSLPRSIHVSTIARSRTDKDNDDCDEGKGDRRRSAPCAWNARSEAAAAQRTADETMSFHEKSTN